MTAVPHTKQPMGISGDAVELWAGLKAGSVADPCELSLGADLHIQVLGAFEGAQVAMEGSNAASPEEGDWSALTDAFGTPLLFEEGSSIKRADTVPCRVRPVVRGGAENTDLRVLMLIRKIVR